MKSKRVLVLNASYIEERPITILKELGCYVITTGNRPDFPGHKLADEYVPWDYSDKEGILQLAREKQIDAICACCNDTSVKTASYVAEKLGLPGHDTYRSACIINNKDEFKEFAWRSGVITTAPGECFTDPDAAMQWAEKADGFPLIVKPVDLDSGKGVKRVDTREELLGAITEAFEKSLSGHIVIEKFIKGTQHGFCTFLANKKVVAISSDNEISVVNPYRVEVASWPATCFEQIKDQLVSEIEYMAEQLDLADGIFHLQFIFRDGKAYILECMRRLIGNLCNRVAQVHSDFDWDYWYVRATCGFGCEGIPTRLEPLEIVGIRSLLSTKGGKFKKLRYPAEMEKNMLFKRILLNEGDTIKRPYFDPIALLAFRFESMEELKKKMIDGYYDISVITDTME